MLLKIPQHLIHSLIFDDTPVVKMEFEPEQKFLKLYLKGAVIHDDTDSLFMNRRHEWLGEGILVFTDWGSLVVHRYVSKEEFVLVNQSEVEQLEDILKFEEEDNVVKIGGLGIKTAHWEEWIIRDSKYFGEFEEYPISL